MKVPFFRPSISEREIAEVVKCLRSGWLTTGRLSERFERSFAERVGAAHAIALTSCTAALHLAVEALDLQPGQAVLVPTMTFAATAEVVRYRGAIPILVDCEPATAHLDLTDAARKIDSLGGAGPRPARSPGIQVVGIIPVHVGGLMMDVARVGSFARRRGLWVVEDAAHAFPAAWRRGLKHPWQHCGGGTAAVSCFSFYANKTVTTGEGGMATTADDGLAERMRRMSLHGIAPPSGERVSEVGSWDYRIESAGYKYNLPDTAAALGIPQLARAESMRETRETLATGYRAGLDDVAELELPPVHPDRVHSWHLFPIRLVLDRLLIDRDAFLHELIRSGVGCSVHWRPLHLHPYYERLGWTPDLFPIATREWKRSISLPLFPDMREDEQRHVIDAVKGICRRFRSRAGA